MLTLASLKQFLKPSWGKIIIFIVLAGVCLVFYKTYPRLISGSETIHIILGYPLKYIEYSYGAFDLILDVVRVNYLNLAIDLIFWYLASCLVIFAWDKIKNKKQ